MLESDISKELTTLHAQHAADPKAYDVASAEFLKQSTRATKDPILRASMQSYGESLRTQHLNGLTMKKAQLDTENAKTALVSQIESAKDTLFALARQGGDETPEFQQSRERLAGLYDALGANPLYGFPTEKVDIEKARFVDEAKAQVLVGQVDRAYNKLGRASAQKEPKERLLDNPDLKIPEAERIRLYNWGLSRLEALSAETKAQIDANRQVVNAITTGLSNRSRFRIRTSTTQSRNP